MRRRGRGGTVVTRVAARFSPRESIPKESSRKQTLLNESYQLYIIYSKNDEVLLGKHGHLVMQFIEVAHLASHSPFA